MDTNGNGNGEPTIRFKVKDILQEIKASVVRIEDKMATKAEQASVHALEVRVGAVETELRTAKVAKEAVDRYKRMVYSAATLALLGLIYQVLRSFGVIH